MFGIFKKKSQDPLDSVYSKLTRIVSNNVRLVEENALFKSVLKIGVIYVADIDTDIILYANDNAKDKFGERIEGQVCYEVLQNEKDRCTFCTNNIITKEEGKPHFWVYPNSKTMELYLIADVYNKLKTNGSFVRTRFEIAIPIDDKLLEQLNAEYKKVQRWRMKM